jgi:hypothetical protein
MEVDQGPNWGRSAKEKKDEYYVTSVMRLKQGTMKNINFIL